MPAINKIKTHLAETVSRALKESRISPENFLAPPNPAFGDLSLACFEIAKTLGKNPVEAAKELAGKITTDETISGVKAIGPYLNFTLNTNNLSRKVIAEVAKENNKYGVNKNGRSKIILVEFAHPNTHKAFHIGHLRNIITGEAVARILAANGFKVVRANYQGDVGLHIAKCLWAISRLAGEYKEAAKKSVEEKVKFLGQAYALGSKNYEAGESAKKEIVELNKLIYSKDKKIKSIYEATRKWSLEYFDKIYERLGTKFDRLYFESEVFERGKKIVEKNLASVFKKSDGAIIFPGADFGLHNRVFINSEGFPTYEAKDMALAELQFKEYKPKNIIHVVATEQNEYFKVIIKALELVFPRLKGLEIHLPYGWVRLKEGKMSSRLGNVVLGEWLLDEVAKKIRSIMEENKSHENTEKVTEKISQAAVKYSILKSSIAKEIAFDIDESISLSGSSGPYLQYTYARVASILRKAKGEGGQKKIKASFENLSHPKEHKIIFKLACYPEAVEKAGKNYDPAEIAKYLFELAQMVNDYYHDVPVLKAEIAVQSSRLVLLKAINQVIANGLALLGIKTLEKM